MNCTYGISVIMAESSFYLMKHVQPIASSDSSSHVPSIHLIPGWREWRECASKEPCQRLQCFRDRLDFNPGLPCPKSVDTLKCANTFVCVYLNICSWCTYIVILQNLPPRFVGGCTMDHCSFDRMLQRMPSSWGSVFQGPLGQSNISSAFTYCYEDLMIGA